MDATDSGNKENSRMMRAERDGRNPSDRATGKPGGPRLEPYYYTEQQLQEAARAFSLASSSSA